MIPASVKAVVEAAIGKSNVTITLRVPQVHQSNQLFDVWVNDRHLIAKQFMKEDEWGESPAREFRSLNLLLPLDIAPRPVFYDATLAPVVIYEYMEGRMWGRYQPSADELSQLATSFARLHALPTDGLWHASGSELTPPARVAWLLQWVDDYAAWTKVHFPSGQQLVKLCRELVKSSGRVFEQLYRSMPRRRFCRMDPRFANVIACSDGSLGFVDWEDAGLHDPALEMADLMLHPEQEDLLSREEWQSYFTSYCQATGYEHDELTERVEDYCKALSVFWLVILLRSGVRRSQQGELAAWDVNELSANLRLQRYLARALAESQYDFDASAYTDVIFFPIG